MQYSYMERATARTTSAHLHAASQQQHLPIFPASLQLALTAQTCMLCWRSATMTRQKENATCQKSAWPASKAASAHNVPADPDPHTLPCANRPIWLMPYSSVNTTLVCTQFCLT